VLEYRDRVLAVARADPLATRASVSLEDLADREVAQMTPPFPPALHDAIFPPRAPSGREIRRGPPVRSIHELVSLVARGQIVHPTASGIPMFTRDDIALVPITGLPPLPLGLIWVTAHENARIRALAETARSIG
jgi:DNA-binding transcriptional LysR family regulator